MAAGFHIGLARLLQADGTLVWQVEAISAKTAERWTVTAAAEAEATAELAVQPGFDVEE